MEYYDSETHERWWRDYAAGRDSRFLHNFTDSLEVLELLGEADIIETLEPSTVWHAVRELKLTDWGTSVRLYTLARAFPNLRRLHLDARCLDEVVPENHWRQLDYVYAFSPSALQQHVRYLDMYWPIELYLPGSAAVRDATTALLQHVKPVVLKCRACP